MNRCKTDELEKVIDKYQEEMFRYAFFRTGSLEDSQDIIQNVFLRMYENSPKIRSIKSYLYRSILNSCLNYLRTRHTRKITPLDPAVSDTADTDDELMREYERIDGMMGKLPWEQAEIIRMRTVDGLPFMEIAMLLNIPVSTAKSRFKYGIDKLRNSIKKEEEKP